MYVDFMSKAPDTIEALFEAFGQIKTFSDLVGCGYEAARQMKRRGSIAVEHWPKVVEACNSAGVEHVDYDALARMHLHREDAA